MDVVERAESSSAPPVEPRDSGHLYSLDEVGRCRACTPSGGMSVDEERTLDTRKRTQLRKQSLRAGDTTEDLVGVKERPGRIRKKRLGPRLDEASGPPGAEDSEASRCAVGTVFI